MLDFFDSFSVELPSGCGVPNLNLGKNDDVWRVGDLTEHDGYSSHFTESWHRSSKKRKRDHRQDGFLQLCWAGKLFRPRIVKNDVRRNYPNMFANVFNSGDFDIAERYLETYFSNSCELHHRNGDVGLEPITRSVLSGHTELKAFWHHHMSFFPDTAMSINHAQVSLRADGTAVVTIGVVIRGTATTSIQDAIATLNNNSYMVNRGLNPKRGAVPRVKEIILSKAAGSSHENADVSRSVTLPNHVQHESPQLCEAQLYKRQTYHATKKPTAVKKTRSYGCTGRKPKLGDVLQKDAYSQAWRAIGWATVFGTEMCHQVREIYPGRINGFGNYPTVNSTKRSGETIGACSTAPSNNYGSNLRVPAAITSVGTTASIAAACEPVRSVSSSHYDGIYNNKHHHIPATAAVEQMLPDRIGIDMSVYTLCMLYLDTDSKIAAVEICNLEQEGRLAPFRVHQ